MQFDGCFAIDEYMIQRKDGTPVDAGFGADFNDAGGPVASWVWFSRPVNGPVRAKFEERFNEDSSGLFAFRMQLDGAHDEMQVWRWGAA